ncbi:MAG: phosphoribosylanthranilate isomerase [Vicinamibacterales bacterium]|nr:phosphoribosylanthranilate isomerase [Vicinamibacterales bacterium]
MIPVKICGITRVEDAALAAELGATWIGFVFWPGSPRFVPRAAAADILAAMPPHVTGVGVFVDQPPAEVDATAAQVGLGAVQLHGDESPDAYLVGGRRVIKALRLAPESRERAADAVWPGATLLLDAFDPVRMGGTGRQVDWTVAAAIARRRRTILSGGLRAENVQEAMARVAPYALDVSSGIETTPGIKDPARMRDFFDAVRRAAPPSPAGPIESTSGAQS